MKSSLSLSVSLTLITLPVLACVSAGDPLPEGQPGVTLPQGTTTHTVFASPDWATCRETNGCLTSRRCAATRPWCGGWEVDRTFTLSLCDLNESLETGNKNGYSNKAAEGIYKHGGILCSSALLSFNGHTVIRIHTRTAIQPFSAILLICIIF